MSDYKLTLKLKQHTPIIHFQHDQHGATLRASELKPKLDKYILMKLGKEADGVQQENEAIYKKGYEVAKSKKWLVGKGKHPALDYKVKVEQDGNIKFFLPLPFISNIKKNNVIDFLKDKTGNDVSILAPSPFFANADKIKFTRGSNKVNTEETKTNELKIGLLINKEIEVTIQTFKIGLKEKLQQYIIPFFLLNNFGTRQDKGFGSYSVTNLDNKEIVLNEKILNEVFIRCTNKVYFKFDELFGFILDEYQIFKSGKNFPDYKKSELFNYFINKNIRWEKRYIKQLINSNRILGKELYWNKKSAPIDIENSSKEDYNDWTDKQSNNYKFIRALLGLAEQFEYRVFSETKDKKGNWVRTNNVDPNKMYLVSLVHKPKSGKEKIERFKSPIFFKVIDGIVYLGIDDSYQDILGEEFEFSLKFKGDKKGTVKTIGKLEVPQAFELEDFVISHISSKWRTVIL